jgi:hypothetical protein
VFQLASSLISISDRATDYPCSAAAAAAAAAVVEAAEAAASLYMDCHIDDCQVQM